MVLRRNGVWRVLETSQEYDVILFNRIDIGGADFELAQVGLQGSFISTQHVKPNESYDIMWFRKAQFNFKLIGSYRLRTFLEQHGYSVKVIDYSNMLTLKQAENLLNKLITKRTKIVGANGSFGFYNLAMQNVNKLFEKTKEKFPHIKVVVGGQNSHSLQPLLSNADYFVDGYGENALLALLEDKVPEGETMLNGTFGYGFPNEYLTTWKDEDCILPGDVMPIETARGCIFACKFCSFPLVGKKKNDYIGDFEQLKEALIINHEKYGTTRYTITEETFNDNIYKLEEIAKIVSDLPFKFRFSSYVKPELLVAKPDMIDLLVAIGLEHGNMGIESLNRETRKAVAKGYDYPVVAEAIKELKKKSLEAGHWDFGSSFNIIVGLPFESQESYNKGIEYLLNSYECDKIIQHRLSIRKTDGRWAHQSPIDADPAKYGYTIMNYPVSATGTKRVKGLNTSIESAEALNFDPNDLFWKNNKDIDHEIAAELVDKWSTDIHIFNKVTGFADGLTGLEVGLNRLEFYSMKDAKLWNLSLPEKEQIGRNFKQRIQDWYNYQMSM